MQLSLDNKPNRMVTRNPFYDAHAATTGNYCRELAVAATPTYLMQVLDQLWNPFLLGEALDDVRGWALHQQNTRNKGVLLLILWNKYVCTIYHHM